MNSAEVQNNENLENGELNAEKERIRGLEGFMGMRNNVWEMRDLLWHELTPLEMRLVDIIIGRTIKWDQEVATFTISELRLKTRKQHSHIYEALKSLEKKEIITRSKNRMGSVLGLNDKVFGELLAYMKRKEKTELRKTMRIITNPQAPSMSPRRTQDVPLEDTSCPPKGQVMSPRRTSEHNQPNEIIEESPILHTPLTPTPIQTSLKDSDEIPEMGREILSLPSGNGNGETPEKELKPVTFENLMRLRGFSNTIAMQKEDVPKDYEAEKERQLKSFREKYVS